MGSDKRTGPHYGHLNPDTNCSHHLEVVPCLFEQQSHFWPQAYVITDKHGLFQNFISPWGLALPLQQDVAGCPSLWPMCQLLALVAKHHPLCVDVQFQVKTENSPSALIP